MEKKKLQLNPQIILWSYFEQCGQPSRETGNPYRYSCQGVGLGWRSRIWRPFPTNDHYKLTFPVCSCIYYFDVLRLLSTHCETVCTRLVEVTPASKLNAWNTGLPAREPFLRMRLCEVGERKAGRDAQFTLSRAFTVCLGNWLKLLVQNPQRAELGKKRSGLGGLETWLRSFRWLIF